MHLNLHPYITCIICRRSIIEEEDQVFAVLRGTRSYYGYTNSITVPYLYRSGDQLSWTSCIVHPVNSQTTSWHICHQSRCSICRDSPEAALCHVACFNTISKHIYLDESRIVLEEICDTAKFFRAWPQAGDDYYLAREPKTIFSSSLSYVIQACDAAMKNFVMLLRRISQFPPEVIQIIESFCPESELWRLWSSLAWHKTFYEEKISSHSIWELGNWQRGDQPFTTFTKKATAKFVLLTMDNQGLKEVRFLEQRPIDQGRNYGQWFACFETAQVKSIQAEFKGGRICLDRRPENLILWDVPHIPDPAFYFSAGLTPTSCRVRMIPLDKLTGLTLFISNGGTFAIYPHYEGCSNSILQTYLSIPPNRRSFISWVFVPLKTSYIKSLWVHTNRVSNRPFMFFPNLVLKTNGDQTYLTGLYPTTFQNSQNYKFEPIGVNPSILTYNDPLPGNPIMRFGSYASHLNSTVYIRPHFEIQVSKYFSVACLKNVQALATFCDKTYGYCRGVLIYYHNEDQQVLGQCRNDLIRQDFHISLLGFHWRQVTDSSYVQVAFSRNEQEMNELRDQGYKTAVGGDIMWLFNHDHDVLYKVPL